MGTAKHAGWKREDGGGEAGEKVRRSEGPEVFA